MVLDTNGLSAWAENEQALRAILPPDHVILLPTIVIGEYKFGILRSTHRERLESWLAHTIRAVRIGEITIATTDSYAAVRVMMREKGRPIPPNDAWIAALALQHGLPVLSRDSHYDFVDGLTRVTW